jgi:DNA (cytosine-5)-methyltransferase 1
MVQKHTQIRVFDLFCGAGGSSCGARMAGTTPVGGVDLWDLATAAYLTNNPGATIYTTDLARLGTQKVKRDLGPIDLLLASPECTHHSVAKGNAPRSEASRQLAFEVIRFAKALGPRWVVVENVIQMERLPHSRRGHA